MISTQELAAHNLCDALFRLTVLNPSDAAILVLQRHRQSLLEELPVSAQDEQIASIIERVLDMLGPQPQRCPPHYCDNQGLCHYCGIVMEPEWANNA